MKYSFLYILISGFVVGILFRSYIDLGFSFSIFLFALSVVIFLFHYFVSKEKENYYEGKVSIIAIAVFVFFVGLGVLRFDIADLNKGDLVLDKVVGQEVVLEGVITDEPDEREDNTRIIISFENLILESDNTNIDLNNKIEQKADFTKERGVKTKGLIIKDIYPKFSYGDRVRVKGELIKPKNFINNDGRDFDYVTYLAKDDIFYQMFYPQIEFISDGNGNFIKKELFVFKRKFLEKIERVIPDPQSSLLGGLVVGAKQSLGEKLQEDFRKTGIIHIVVLSGYNVTIVAEGIMRLFSFLPYTFGILIGSVSIIFFAILTGGSATIIRASIMAIFVLIARTTKRTQTITRALFIAGFLMLLHNPKILAFDSSFQLSFMATIGLIYLAPKIEKYFHLIPTRFQLREFAVATIATQVFVLPMILYKMGMLSFVALPVNMLILIFVPITMFFGFITGMIGFVSVFLSLPFAYITNILLTYELKVVDIFASFPFASIEIKYFPLWIAILVYVIYGLFMLKLKSK